MACFLVSAAEAVVVTSEDIQHERGFVGMEAAAYDLSSGCHGG